MSTLVFDIETIGEKWEATDEVTQDSLTRWAKKEAGSDAEYEILQEDIKQGLGFSPLTGEIVAIGVIDVEKNKGAVYYQSPGTNEKESEHEGIKFKPMTEKEMLEHFWKGAEEYEEFVSFNGRGFDAPFLALRSAIHGIRPSRDLMEGRYAYQQRTCKHTDLLDQLSFYGAVRRKGNLHLFCRAFGIESPKAQGVSGDDVSALFAEKRFFDIAKYNVGDLRATKSLYEKWAQFLR